MLLISYLLIFFLQIISSSSDISGSDYLLMPDIFHLDNYDKCMLYEQKAFYCSIIFKLNPLNVANQTKIWKLIKKVSTDITNYRHDLLRHGICISENYPHISENMYTNKEKIREEVTKSYNAKYTSLGLKGQIIKMNCETESSPYATDIYDKLFIYISISYVTIVICVTLYDIVSNKNKDKHMEKNYSFCGKLVMALSIRKNWQRLMAVDHRSDSDFEALSFMQAIRLYIMLTVIACHTIISYIAGPISNSFVVEKRTKGKYLELQIDSALSMQTFFMMTSWLLTYNFFLVHQNSKNIPLAYFVKQFLKRYIRLTPVLGFAVLFASTIMVHQSRGPLWDDYVGDTYRKCRENWWTNLLYLNNIVNEERMCLTHTWFLASNTQLYVLSLILLYLMWNYQKKIWCILGTVLLLHVAYLFFIIYINGWGHMPPPALEAIYNEQFMKWRQWHELWTSTWANLAGLVAGLTYGYVFYKIRNKEIKIKKVYTAICWIIGFGVPSIVAIVDQMIVSEDLFYNALYGSLKRVIFSFSVGLAMLLMAKLKGRVISWLYESGPLYILGRLTYSMYVIHPILQRVLEGTKRSPSYVAQNIIALKAVGDFMTALIAATLLFLFIEMPILELSKLFMAQKKVEKAVCRKTE